MGRFKYELYYSTKSLADLGGEELDIEALVKKMDLIGPITSFDRGNETASTITNTSTGKAYNNVGPTSYTISFEVHNNAYEKNALEYAQKLQEESNGGTLVLVDISGDPKDWSINSVRYEDVILTGISESAGNDGKTPSLSVSATATRKVTEFKENSKLSDQPYDSDIAVTNIGTDPAGE